MNDVFHIRKDLASDAARQKVVLECARLINTKGLVKMAGSRSLWQPIFKDKGKGVERPAFAIYKGTDIAVRVGEDLIDICVPPGYATVVYKGAAMDRNALMKKLLRHQQRVLFLFGNPQYGPDDQDDQFRESHFFSTWASSCGGETLWPTTPTISAPSTGMSTAPWATTSSSSSNRWSRT